MGSLNHAARTAHSGVFATWSRAFMRAWLDEQIAKTRRQIGREEAA